MIGLWQSVEKVRHKGRYNLYRINLQNGNVVERFVLKKEI